MTRAVPKNLRTLDPPAAVREIVARLERDGYETWCVGGAVRDALLGQGHLDWDLATAATPQQIMKVFKRTVPVGVEFGTVGVLDSDNTMHEVTTFRRDVKTDGRHAVVEFGVSLDDDLARRDFTINALAYHPQKEEFRDLYEGRLDLERGIVRAVGVAADRMREDRLRALRGIRFASRFGFHIEPDTWHAIKASAPHMGRLSAERVKQEIEKTMEQVAAPSIAFEWWRESGALEALVPALANAPDERFRALDALPRAAAGADEATIKGATLDRLAMLFFGDEPAAVERATRALKFSNADSTWIVQLARAWQQVGGAIATALASGGGSGGAGGGASEVSDAQLRRWVATIGRTRTDTFFRLSAALAPVAEALRERAVRIAFRDPIEIADLAVDGEDLRAAGVPDGPQMGRVLKALLDKVIDDPALNTVAVLAGMAKGLAGSK